MRFKEYIIFLNYKYKIAYIGSNSSMDVLSSKYLGLENIEIGNNVYIAHGAVFYSTNAKLKIGNNVMFGPNPTIITGDHRIDLEGVFMSEVTMKLLDNDKDVFIDDDVWIGANVTILKGVTIGRGSIVGAGSVVTKSCPPYSIIVGNPARIKSYRFSIEQVINHELNLYPKENRLSIVELTNSRSNLK